MVVLLSLMFGRDHFPEHLAEQLLALLLFWLGQPLGSYLLGKHKLGMMNSGVAHDGLLEN
jgi:hypothetical protein